MKLLEHIYEEETGKEAWYGHEPFNYPGRIDYYPHEDYVTWLEERCERLEQIVDNGL